MCIFFAHAHWDWYTIPKEREKQSASGREARLPEDHVARVQVRRTSPIPWNH